jgi:hypothetical protein
LRRVKDEWSSLHHCSGFQTRRFSKFRLKNTADNFPAATDFDTSGEVGIVRVPGRIAYLTASGTSGGVPFEEALIFLSGTFTIDTTTNNADGNDTINLNGGAPTHGVDDLKIVTGVGNDVVNVTGDEELNGTLTIDTGGLVQGSGKVSAKFGSTTNEVRGLEAVIIR